MNINSWLLTGEITSNTHLGSRHVLSFPSRKTEIIQQVIMHTMHYVCAKVEEATITR